MKPFCCLARLLKEQLLGKLLGKGGGVPAKGVLVSRTYNRSLLMTHCAHAQDEGQV